MENEDHDRNNVIQDKQHIILRVRRRLLERYLFQGRVQFRADFSIKLRCFCRYQRRFPLV
jgi:hypothetical protein